MPKQAHALERERGITILAKNTAMVWNDVKINAVNAPGYDDFVSEAGGCRQKTRVNGWHLGNTTLLRLRKMHPGPHPLRRLFSSLFLVGDTCCLLFHQVRAPAQ